jgi:hypothetical protein
MINLQKSAAGKNNYCDAGFTQQQNIPIQVTQIC